MQTVSQAPKRVMMVCYVEVFCILVGDYSAVANFDTAVSGPADEDSSVSKKVKRDEGPQG